MPGFEHYAYVLLVIVYTVALSFSVFVTWYSFGAANGIGNGWRNSLLLRARISALVTSVMGVMFALVVALAIADGLQPIARGGGIWLSAARVGVFYVVNVLLSAAQLTTFLSTSHLFNRKNGG
jgi:hypothetical protein